MLLNSVALTSVAFYSSNWVTTLTVSLSWAFKIDKFSVHGHDIPGKNLTVSSYRVERG